MQTSSNFDIIVHSTDNILDGSNRNMLTLNMEAFLRGHKLWHYVSRDVIAPKQQDREGLDVFEWHLEDWNSVHYKILFWFIYTFILSIYSLLPKLGNAKTTWNHLITKWYNYTNDASL